MKDFSDLTGYSRLGDFARINTEITISEMVVSED